MHNDVDVPQEAKHERQLNAREAFLAQAAEKARVAEAEAAAKLQHEKEELVAAKQVEQVLHG